MTSPVLTVWRKEVTENFRDRLTVEVYADVPNALPRHSLDPFERRLFG